MQRPSRRRFGPRPRRRRGAMGRRARRGIFILPSLLTVANIFAGYASIIAAGRGDFTRAAVLLILAGVLDNLDGRVARLTGTSTEFGVQFDSLADVISFGIAPAFLITQWGMLPLGRLGWVASFLFLVAGAMRLARFNIHSPPGRAPLDRAFFVGLPIPAAAMVVAALVFYRPEPVDEPALSVAVLLLVLTLGGLMVSRLRYRSFKSLDSPTPRQSFLTVGLLALILALVAVNPQVMLLSLAILYMLSGLLPRLPREGAPVWASRHAAGGGTDDSRR